MASADWRKTVRCLRRLVFEHGDPRAWPVVAVERTDAILRAASARELIWLEANRGFVARSHGEVPLAIGWERLEPVFVADLPPPVQRLLTFHGNGRVREAAVAALASSTDASDLPLLLFRANDWVLQVSARARSALENRLSAVNAAAWLSALPLEAHVRSLRRRDLAYLFDEARKLLVSPPHQPVIDAALRSGSTDLRRAAASLLASLPDEARAGSVALALHDHDPIVAHRASDVFFASHASAEALRALLRHRVALVRARALAEAWARGLPDALGRTNDLLFDPAAWAREVAQFELRRRAGTEPSTLYAAALPIASKRRLVAALAGLAETGAVAHAPLFEPFVDNSSPRVRTIALRALAKLDGDRHVPHLLAALHDTSPRVRRLAVDELPKRAHQVDRAKLEAMLGEGDASATMALKLLARVDPWRALAAALEAAPSPPLRATANAVIARVTGHQLYSNPPDWLALEAAFVRARPHLDSPADVARLLALTQPTKARS